MERESRSRLKRGVLWSAVVIVISATLYTGYWFVIRHQMTAEIDAWTAARRAEGWIINHDPPVVTGYPGEVQAEYGSPSVTPPAEQGRWQWRAESLTLSIRPFAPGVLLATAPGQHVFRANAAEAPVTVTGDAESLRAKIGLLAEPIETEISAQAVTLRIGDGDTAEVARIDLTVQPAQNGSPDDVRVIVDADDVRLPESLLLPLGHEVGHFGARILVVGADGTRMTPEQILAWRDAGGRLEVESLRLDYGPLGVDATGQLALDDDGQPIGRMDAKVAGALSAVNALIDAGYIEHDAALGTRVLLSVLQQDAADGGPPFVAIPISLQDSVVRVGAIISGPIPRIEWPIDPRRATPSLPEPRDSR